jgi:hypothetical protein
VSLTKTLVCSNSLTTTDQLATDAHRGTYPRVLTPEERMSNKRIRKCDPNQSEILAGSVFYRNPDNREEMLGVFLGMP